MTRINCIPVDELMDQHLMAEYRELPMVGASLRRSRLTKNFHYSKSKQYILGTGHVRFFYDKGKYLITRYEELKHELIMRGFNLSSDRSDNMHHFLYGEMNTWVPSIEDQRVNRERINTRILARPNWYRYYGETL